VPSPLRASVASLATLAMLPLGPAPLGAAGQLPFRASLTAAVIISSDRTGGKHGDALGCREVALRWAAEPGAERYDVYVSPRVDGPWTALSPTNVCGRVRWTAPTGVVDVEPTLGAASVVHRLYYKVFAVRRTATGAAAVAVTDVVGVELP
jgi:hypothetical protein